jgi:hypothetical protein
MHRNLDLPSYARSTYFHIGTMDYGRGWGVEVWFLGTCRLHWLYTFKRCRDGY